MGRSLRALLAASRWERSLVQQLRNHAMRLLHLFMSLHRRPLLATGHTASRPGTNIMVFGCLTEFKYVTNAWRGSVRLGEPGGDHDDAVVCAACDRALGYPARCVVLGDLSPRSAGRLPASTGPNRVFQY